MIILQNSGIGNKFVAMRFADIPGLEELKRKLIASVRDHKVPHASLFHGKEGALSLPMTIAFAAYLHCENRTSDDSCGLCAGCNLSKKFIHPDTHFAFPVGNMKTELKEKDDEKLRNELLKLWRSFLSEHPFGSPEDWISYYGGDDKQPIISREDGREIIRSLSLRPFQSKVKVMIIWQPEMMHSSAANGLLKILEEPPAYTYFMLATSQANQLLPTILSRTQKISVPVLSEEEMKKALSTRVKADPVQLDRAIGFAQGDVQEAIRLLSLEENDYQELFQEWMRSCFKLDPVNLIQLSEKFHGDDRLQQRGLMLYGLHIMRESLLLSAKASDLWRSRGKELDFVQKFSSVLSVNKIDKVATAFNDSIYQLERNGSAKMIFMDLSLKINAVLKA